MCIKKVHMPIDCSCHRIGNGSWSIREVVTLSITFEDNQTVVTCQSSHLTSFAVLVDVSGSVDEVDVCVPLNASFLLSNLL